MKIDEIAQKHAHELITKLQTQFGIKDSMFPMDEQVFDNTIHQAFSDAISESRRIEVSSCEVLYSLDNPCLVGDDYELIFTPVSKVAVSELKYLLHAATSTEIDATKVAREIRLAVVQQQYKRGNLTLEEARELLSGPLVPGDKKTVYDDSAKLVE